jgi:hypothetical protein
VSEPLLNVMKIMLLAGLYLFFVRVLWSVYNELRDPRTVVRRPAKAAAPDAESVHATVRRPAPAAAATPANRQYAPSGASVPSRPASRQQQGTAVMVGQLVVIEPAQRAGVTYALGNEATLGRAPTNTIHLDDTYVSSVHARIFLTNGEFFIEDLASRNGSLLNGEPLVATTALVPGDRLQLGATTMEFS